MKKLTEAILQLSNNLQNFGLCKHELKEMAQALYLLAVYRGLA